MPISNSSGVVSAIMLDNINEMDSNDFVSRRWLSFVSLILEDLISFHGCKFKLGSILPLGVAIVLINLNSMSEISWNLIPIFVFSPSAEFPTFSKVGKPEKILLSLG